jgi:hypothetical protein
MASVLADMTLYSGESFIKRLTDRAWSWFSLFVKIVLFSRCACELVTDDYSQIAERPSVHVRSTQKLFRFCNFLDLF